MVPLILLFGGSVGYLTTHTFDGTLLGATVALGTIIVIIIFG